MGSIFGLPVRADDTRPTIADKSQNPPIVEPTATDREQRPAFQFTDADGPSRLSQRGRWRNVLKIGNGTSATEPSADTNRTDAPAGLHFEGGPLPPRTTNGSDTLRPVSGDLTAPATAQFRFLDAEPPLARSGGDAELMTFTIDGVRTKSATADTAADAVPGFSFADTPLATPATPVNGTSDAEPTPAHPLRVLGIVQTPDWEPTRSEQTLVAPHDPRFNLGGDQSASAEGRLVTIQQRSDARSDVASVTATSEATPPASPGKSASSMSDTPAATVETATTPAAWTTTPAPSPGWPPKPADIVTVSSFEPEQPNESMPSAALNALPTSTITAVDPTTVCSPDPADIECATSAEITTGQLPLPVAMPADAESLPDASSRDWDAGASGPEEPEWLSPAPSRAPQMLEIEAAYAGATKPSGAAAVPQTGNAYPMGPGRMSRPLPPATSAGQPRMPADRSAAGHIITTSVELAALLDDLQPLLPGGSAPVDVEEKSSPTAADFPSTSTEASDTGASSGAAGAGAPAEGVNIAEQTLGQRPEETNEPLQFLRRQTVLLEPGEHQFDVGISYLNDMSDFPVLLSDGVNFGVVRGQARQRLLSVPLELRVGIAPYTQAFVNVPFGWSNSEVSFNGSEFTEDQGGIGDVSAGITRQIIMGNQYYPDVLASLAFSAPTGDSSITTALGTPGSSLGQGFWTLTGGLSFIQTYDPLVIFYGLGYTFRFQNEFGDNIEIEPGDQVFYRFGAGFAVNPHVTLSAAFTGSVIGRDKVDGIEIGGSIREPMSIRLAATISRRKGSKTHSSFKLVEPYVNFGLNEDSIDTLIGISWTH